MERPLITGALRAVGEHLHDDPSAAFRELADLAHAACRRRATAGERGYVPAILVTTQLTAGTAFVSICDNGDAIVPDDVRRLYAALRGGRTGAVRRAIERAGADHVVGELGAGLLAAVLVADRIVISSRRREDPVDDAVRYTCDSRTYRIERSHLARPGNVIQLRVRPERRELGELAVIRSALVEHARAHDVPVRIGNDPAPLNA